MGGRREREREKIDSNSISVGDFFFPVQQMPGDFLSPLISLMWYLVAHLAAKPSQLIFAIFYV